MTVFRVGHPWEGCMLPYDIAGLMIRHLYICSIKATVHDIIFGCLYYVKYFTFHPYVHADNREARPIQSGGRQGRR